MKRSTEPAAKGLSNNGSTVEEPTRWYASHRQGLSRAFSGMGSQGEGLCLGFRVIRPLWVWVGMFRVLSKVRPHSVQLV